MRITKIDGNVDKIDIEIYLNLWYSPLKADHEADRPH